MNQKTKYTCENRKPSSIVSIDIGSLTARMLICNVCKSPELLQPIVRERAYIRLADDSGGSGDRIISAEAINRTINALDIFLSIIALHRVHHIRVVATGIVREAKNQAEFIDLISQRTGLSVRVISGEKEALLTCKGVVHALQIRESQYVIFDLGGGTTEFIVKRRDTCDLRSLPLGAVVLTRRFFTSNLPHTNTIKVLSQCVDEMITKAFTCHEYTGSDVKIVGSGGTVISLGAMIHCIPVNDISPARLNGMIIEKRQIEALFRHLQARAFSDRLTLPGLDRDRAEVIDAGLVVVLRILDFFQSQAITVSYSDILEGSLLDYLEGENDE